MSPIETGNAGKVSVTKNRKEIARGPFKEKKKAS